MSEYLAYGRGPKDAAAPSGGGSNTETLTGSKTLTNLSPTIQFLDPGSSDRDVNLPAAGAGNPAFIIAHTGLANALLVKNSSGVLVGIIKAQQIGQCVPDGSNWVYSGMDASGDAFFTGGVFRLGGDINIDGRSRQVNARATSGTSDPGGSNPYQSETVMPTGGVLHVVTARVDGNDTWLWKVWKNGAVSESFIADGSGTNSPYPGVVLCDVETEFAQDDKLQIEEDSIVVGGSNSGEGTVVAYARSSEGICAIPFGGDPSLGQYIDFCGHNQAGSRSTLTVGSVIPVPACNGTYFSWRFGNAPTSTTFKIWKNGASSESVVTGAVRDGSAAITTSFASGDEVGLEYDAGTDPSQSHYTIWTDFNGAALVWGRGGSGGPSQDDKYLVNAVADYAGAAWNNQTSGYEQTIPYTSYTSKISWRSSATSSSTALRLAVNGVNVEDLDFSSGTSGIIDLNTILRKGDIVGINYNTGTDPGDVSMCIWLEGDYGI